MAAPGGRGAANQARLSQAIALHGAGRLHEAEKIYRDLLQREPHRYDLLYLLGIVALALHRPQRAVDLIGRSIRQNAGFPPAHCNRAIALAALQRPVEALASYDQAIALDPDFAAAHYNRGVLLKEFGRLEAAIASFERAVALDAADAEGWNNLGNTLNGVKRHADALACLDKAIGLRPDFAAALCNRGNALTGLKRPAEALASYDRALAVQPDLAEAYCNRGDALHELQRFEAALESFDRACALRPDFAEAWFGKSLTTLLLGRYEEGFRLHEWRQRRSGTAGRSLPYPLWLGDAPLAERTLFIHPELFLGDMINFCRYAKLAEAQGARVVLAVQEPLRRLLSSLSPTISVVAEAERPARADGHCPLMSLPLAFRTTYATVPAAVPYLHAEPERIAAWRQRLGEGGFKIGVCWQGSARSIEMDRDFQLTSLRDIAGISLVRLISLQTGDGVEQLAHLPAVECLDPPGAGIRPFEDSAAIMSNLDLVISADTAMAHLAGALGRPTWIVLKTVPDWRWGPAGDATPWYPTVRLFRQQSGGDWDSVFATIRQALTAKLGVGGRAPFASAPAGT